MNFAGWWSGTVFCNTGCRLLVSPTGAGRCDPEQPGHERGYSHLHTQMWSLLAGAALLLAWGVSFVVQLVGRQPPFCDSMIPVQHDTGFYIAVIMAGALPAVSCQQLPFPGLARQRSIHYHFKTSAGRASRAWWQRMYLDILLLIPACYVLYTCAAGRLQTTLITPLVSVDLRWPDFVFHLV